MLAERPAITDLKAEFARMQRAQFIIWLATKDEKMMRELDRDAAELTPGTGIAYEEIRKEMNAKFGD